MKNIYLVAFIIILTTALIICACAAPAATPSPAPTPEPTPTPSVPPATPPTPSEPEPIRSTETIRIEESDPSFEYTGNWVFRKGPEDIVGSFAVTHLGIYGSNPNQKVDIKFKGTGVSIVHHIAPFCGIMDIKIDGEVYPSLDTYSENVRIKTTTIATDLTYDDHILTVIPSENSNPAADIHTIDQLGPSKPPKAPSNPTISIVAIEVIVPE